MARVFNSFDADVHRSTTGARRCWCPLKSTQKQAVKASYISHQQLSKNRTDSVLIHSLAGSKKQKVVGICSASKELMTT